MLLRETNNIMYFFKNNNGYLYGNSPNLTNIYKHVL